MLAWNWWRERRFPFTTALVGAGVGGAYLLFRVWYYADLFPNTFYLKDGTQLSWGLTYLHDTLVVYGVYVLAPVLLIFTLLLRKRGKDIAMGQRLLLLTMAAMVGAYVIKIGGDGRHYRYLAFPFCLAVCASAGLPERALATFAPGLRSAGVTAVGIVLALVFAWFHPRQLSSHPLSGDVQEQRVGSDSRRTVSPSTRIDLSFSPWGSGREMELLDPQRSQLLYEINGWPPPGRRVWLREEYDRHRTDAPSARRPVTRAESWCAGIWQLFNLRVIHDDGLTDPIHRPHSGHALAARAFQGHRFLGIPPGQYSNEIWLGTRYVSSRGGRRRRPPLDRPQSRIHRADRAQGLQPPQPDREPRSRCSHPFHAWRRRRPRLPGMSSSSPWIPLAPITSASWAMLKVKTPALDALARESVVLGDFMSVAPSTLASHTTLFTGQYPNRHGVPRNGYRVNDLNRMLPEILNEYGFHTAGFVSAFVMSNRFNIAQGFDHFDEYFDQLIPESRTTDYVQRSAASTTDAAIRYLEDVGVPERLFLFVHYFDPHQPYAAPRSFVEMYDPSPGEPLTSLADLAKPNAGNGSTTAGVPRTVCPALRIRDLVHGS